MEPLKKISLSHNKLEAPEAPCGTTTQLITWYEDVAEAQEREGPVAQSQWGGV